ncbi:MAG: hypothetical protein ACRD3T_15015 [Terriglobia bacterium]
MSNPSKDEFKLMKVFRNEPAETELIERQKSETAKREKEIRERLEMSRQAERQSANKE